MQDKKENKNSTLQNEEDFSDLTKDTVKGFLADSVKSKFKI